MGHVSSAVFGWLRSIRVKSPMIRATPEVDSRDERESFKALKRLS